MHVTEGLLYLGLFWKADENYDEMVCDVRASVQRNGHTGRGSLMQSTVRERAQQEPGELADVGHTFNKLFGPEEDRVQHPLTLMMPTGI